MMTSIRMLLVLVLALSFTTPCLAKRSKKKVKKKTDVITNSAKGYYKMIGSYAQVYDDREDLVGSKARLQMVLDNVQKGLPAPYGEMFPQTYRMLKVRGYKYDFPFIFSGKKALIENIFEINSGKLVTVFATVKQKIYRNPNNKRSEKCYYLTVEDVDEGISVTEEINNFKASKFKEVDPRRLAILRDEYADKKVKFKHRYHGFHNGIPGWISNVTNLSSGDHFQIRGGYDALIAGRENPRCVDLILKVPSHRTDSEGRTIYPEFMVYGIFRKLELFHANGSSSYIRYFYVYALEEITKEEKADNGKKAGSD